MPKIYTVDLTPKERAELTALTQRSRHRLVT